MESFIQLTDDDKKKIEEHIGPAQILLLGGVPYSEENGRGVNVETS